jgi:hypothetical protein
MDEMMDRTDGRAVPMHVWVVGGLATIWNAFGCYDYVMTRLRDTDYLAGMMPGTDPNQMLAYIDSFPIWAQFGWGLAVWTGLVGSVLILMRHRWAVAAFGLSVVGMVLSFGYQITHKSGIAAMDEGMAAVVPWIITAVGVLLFLYARQMRIKGVLR